MKKRQDRALHPPVNRQRRISAGEQAEAVSELSVPPAAGAPGIEPVSPPFRSPTPKPALPQLVRRGRMRV